MSNSEDILNGFTAVNGKDLSMEGGGSHKRNSEERMNGQRRITPPGQEKLTVTTTTTQKDDWIPPATASRTSYHGNTQADDESHKRKRADSLDQHSSSAASFHNHALPSASKEALSTVTTIMSEPDSARGDGQKEPKLSGGHEPHGAEGQYRSYLQTSEETRQYSSQEYWQTRQFQQSSYNMPDEQLGEVLQRASRTLDDNQRRDNASPNDDDTPYTPYDTEKRDVISQSDPKKRKRNFSNRTKTGCMTCRKRKKKCDETRPECNNCLRGGFVCSGYPQKGQWPKAESSKPPVPLQSRVEYDSTSYTPHTPQSPYVVQPPITQPRREPLPAYRGQSLRVDPVHGRPIGYDDEQPSASTIPSATISSPETGRLSAISYSGQTATPITASSSAYPGRQLESPYKRLGPLHDMSRQEQRSETEIATPQSANTLPQILHPHPPPENAPGNPQMAAQLALSNLASTQRPRTQKEEMLAGRHYFPFDKELVLERERCNGACWRFNNSTNPNNGVSPEERGRLFRDILQPRDHVVTPTQASPVSPVGRVGENVVVEAPFNCDYGYNISIGQDVAIGKGCTILDTCEVIIGDRCNIGPNVNIYTTTLPIDPKKRLGSRGPSLGKKITIGSDCWIGGGVTILPGRTIGKGSTVGAGSVVTRDVPPFTIVAGNPSRVLRGLISED